MKAEKLVLFIKGRSYIRKHTRGRYKFSSKTYIKVVDGDKYPRLITKTFPYYIEVGKDWECKEKVLPFERTVNYLSKVIWNLGYTTQKTRLNCRSKVYSYRIVSSSFDSGYITLAKYRKLAAKLIKFSNISAIY